MTTRQDERTTGLHHEFPALDTMRAIGALAVMVTHCGFNAGAYDRFGVTGQLLARMDVGVAIFFVLSGFLLARPWLVRAHYGRPGPPIGRYFWKRCLRILPPYIVAAALALALIRRNSDLGAVDWLKTLTMTDIYFSGKIPAGLAQTWSLATEVAFYAVLPLIMLASLGRTPDRLRIWRIGAVLVALSLINVAWFLFLSGRLPLDSGNVNEWLPGYLIWFSAGIALALVQVAPDATGAPGAALRRIGTSPGSCWTIALALLLVASTSVAGPNLLFPATPSEALTKNLLYVLIAGFIILPAVFADAGGAFIWFLSRPALRHLGHISYGIFLLHMPILFFVMWSTGYPLFVGHFLQIFVLTLVLSVAAAEVLYRLVELPFMRLKNLKRGSAATTRAADRATSTR